MLCQLTRPAWGKGIGQGALDRGAGQHQFGLRETVWGKVARRLRRVLQSPGNAAAWTEESQDVPFGYGSVLWSGAFCVTACSGVGEYRVTGARTDTRPTDVDEMASSHPS